MKEEKNKSEEVCKTGSCGCSADYIWLGVAVILFVIAAAMIFGN
jgi:hypothetical protein